MAAATQAGVNHEDGVNVGPSSSTGKMAFYGGTPAAQQAVTYNATITATWVTISDGQGGFGFISSDQIVSVIGAIKDIQHVLTTLNLWA